MKNKLFSLLQQNFRYFLGLFVLLVVERIIEYNSVEMVGIEDVKISYLNSGILFDLFLSFVLLGFSCLLQYGLGFLKIRKQVVLPILSLVILLFNFALIEYFKVARLPLDESIWFFTTEELMMIGDLKAHFTFGVFCAVLALIFVFFLLAAFFGKIRLVKRASSIFCFIMLMSLVFSPFSFYESKKQLATIYVNNRTVFFLGRSLIYYQSQRQHDVENFVEVEFGDFSKLSPNVFPHKIVDEDYPLMHELKGKSEFASYFNKKGKKPPNIVFIIVESLGSDYVGIKGKESGSCMPFLDSLSQTGLYFPNFLSSCQRTFNVLPASLASVPNSTDAKYTMNYKYVPQYSLPLLMNDHYFSRFFCGADLNFTNMNGYLNNLNMNYLVKDWAKKYDKSNEHVKNLWGYQDGYLFQKSWDDFKSQKLRDKPRFDVFLTLSTHGGPFSFPDDGAYVKKVQQHIKNKMIPASVREKIYGDEFEMASYYYTDDQIRRYFNQAKRDSDFENTIFFIYGDHGSATYGKTPISKFNIPLIVYSPLLKKAQTFHAVSSNLDLAPTIIHYLNEQYGLSLADKVPFIGKELDLYPGYRCQRTMPFLSINGTNQSFLDRKHILIEGQLYELQKDLKLKKLENRQKSDYLQSQILAYEKFSRYCLIQDHIVSKQDYATYSKKIAYKLIYQNRCELSKLNEKETFVPIGTKLKLDLKSKNIRATCELDWYLPANTNIDSVAQFTMSVFNIEGSKREQVFWKQAVAQLKHQFKPNAYNKVIFIFELSLKDYIKVKENNELVFYLLNVKNETLKAKNIKTMIYTNMP